MGTLSLQRRLRRWHRWLALLTAVQLLAWTLSGIYFAFIDLDFVRGTHHRQAAEPLPLDLSTFTATLSPGTGYAFHQRLPDEWVVGIETSLGMNWVTTAGSPVEPLSAEEALALGQRLTDLNPTEAELVAEAEPDAEFRGYALPLWRLWNPDAPRRVCYLDPRSGQVVAIRNEAWRIWDLLWSLHIMDYDDREDIGTILLKVFSLLALVTALLGIALYVVIPKKWRRAGTKG